MTDEASLLTREYETSSFAEDKAIKIKSSEPQDVKSKLPPKESVKNFFITPPEIVNALGIKFDLDPCASLVQPWDLASENITSKDDGLNTTWDGCVWCHPPHEMNISNWMKKNIRHKYSIAFFIANVHARSFQSHVLNKADGILFLRSRKRMFKEDGSLGATGYIEPMVLASYGAKCTEALSEAHATEPLLKGFFTTSFTPN